MYLDYIDSSNSDHDVTSSAIRTSISLSSLDDGTPSAREETTSLITDLTTKILPTSVEELNSQSDDTESSHHSGMYLTSEPSQTDDVRSTHLSERRTITIANSIFLLILLEQNKPQTEKISTIVTETQSTSGQQ